MGLTRTSVGIEAVGEIKKINKENNQKIIALAGNPNVGKSSIFNLLTGLHQHTGNWPGKTVKLASGSCTYNKNEYIFVDLPGCYSLKSHSPEEEVARDFILSDNVDLTIVVCDATSLERNLNLVLQIKEITDKVIVCVNLLDEAKKKGIYIDTNELSKKLHCTVIGTIAHKKESINILLNATESFINEYAPEELIPAVTYPEYIETIIKLLSSQHDGTPLKNRAFALESIENNKIQICNKSPEEIQDDIIECLSNTAESIAIKCVEKKECKKINIDTKIDKFLTGKFFGFVSMFLLILCIFWITISGANYPSEILSNFFTSLEQPFFNLLKLLKIPTVLCEMTVYGIYHILTWIVSVMLPPMAIFFPLFTLLEDIGYLPRIAFNLDKCFKKCSACGKQALTMCMGFGCNSAGVVGCRIIDSPRERLIAIITNSFVPCNGRFPAIIALITMFFIGNSGDFLKSFISSIYLALFIILGVVATFFASKLLSKTLLKGVPSSFTLELPPYRKPQISKIIIRSIFDRTLFVLGRAVCVAAPAGLIIWLFANIEVGNTSILQLISDFFDPLGKIMGLDGVILTAFIFGFPANEIVIPLIIMMYVQNGTLSDASNLVEVRRILLLNGWTNVTAVNTVLFMLFHWPCSTTCLTIKAETKSWKWTIVSFLLPTLFGIILCTLVNLIF